MEKTFLIWLDILGFDHLARKLEDNHIVTSSKARLDFIETIKLKVENLEKESEILGKKYGESDDWILVSPSLDLVFKSIADIIDHDTGYNRILKLAIMAWQITVLVKSLFSLVCTLLHYAIFKKEECCEKSKA
jgi:hypothetical protein